MSVLPVLAAGSPALVTAYVLNLLLPYIPAIIIYRLLPDSSVGGWNIKAFGAFGAYVTTFFLGLWTISQNAAMFESIVLAPVWRVVAALLIIFALPGAVVAYLVSRENLQQVKRSSEQITLAESRVAAEPEKAKPAWDLARVTLDAYFNRNLVQITSIFWLSLVVMFLGFAVVSVGIFESFTGSSKVAITAIATGAGIITEFIGATFLFIYRSTIQQAMEYAKSLERINSVGMAMQILDTMPDRTESNDLKSQTKAKVVELLLRRVYGSQEQTVAAEPFQGDRK